MRIATNGRAIRVTKLPNTEIVAAAHTRRNAPLRHRPGVGVTSWVGGTGSSSGSDGHRAKGTGRKAGLVAVARPPTTIGPGASGQAMTYTPTASVSPEPAHHPFGASRPV